MQLVRFEDQYPYSTVFYLTLMQTFTLKERWLC